MCTLLCTLALKKSIFLKFLKVLESMILIGGASSRTRTDTWLPIPDFESGASTSFTTEAKRL